jgi:hypothetical protein
MGTPSFAHPTLVFWALLIQSMNSVGVFCEMLCRSVSKSAIHTAIQQRHFVF